MPIAEVSVCVAGSRSGRALGEAVRSVLDQTLRAFELIVVGDASVELARSFGDPRVRVERAAVGPGADGRNLAVQLARTSLVKVLNPRDLLHPRSLELQIDAIETDPGVAMVASRWHVLDQESRVRLPRRGLSRLTGLHSEAQVGRRVLVDGPTTVGPASTVLFRLDAFRAAGRWADVHPAVMDLDLWLRLLRHGDFLGLPEPLTGVRINPSEDVTDTVRQRRAYVAQLAEAGAYRKRLTDRLGAPATTMRRAGRAMLRRMAGVPRSAA